MSENKRQEPLSRARLVTLAAVPDVVMIFWDRRGLIVPHPRKTPTARRTWPWYEANIAGLMMQLRQFGVPIDGLLQIADTFRQAIAWAELYGLSRDDVMALWTVSSSLAIVTKSQATRNTMQALVEAPGFDREANANIVAAAEPYPAAEEIRDILLPWADEKHGAQRVTGRIMEIWAQMPVGEFRQHLDAYLTISEQPESTDVRAQYQPNMSYFWRAGDQWKFAHGEGGPVEARRDGALATIAVDVSTVIYDVWNRSGATT